MRPTTLARTCLNLEVTRADPESLAYGFGKFLLNNFTIGEPRTLGLAKADSWGSSRPVP